MDTTRYKIWGRMAGLTTEFVSVDDVRNHAIMKSSSLLFEVNNVLREIEDEIQFIHSWDNRSLEPTYFHLKSLTDKLWTYLPSHLISQMNLELQSTMLDSKSPEDLQNTTDTFQSNISPAYSVIGALAEFKYLATRDDTSYTESSDLLLQPSDSTDTFDFDVHRLGKFASKDVNVLVERLICGPTVADELSARAQNLGSPMGAQYRNAVRACLTSDFITNRGGDELRNDFERKVLNQLMKCRA